MGLNVLDLLGCKHVMVGKCCIGTSKIIEIEALFVHA